LFLELSASSICTFLIASTTELDEKLTLKESPYALGEAEGLAYGDVSPVTTSELH